MKVVYKQEGGGWAAEGEEPLGLQPPGWCILSHDIDGPFLDTEIDLTDRMPTEDNPVPAGQPPAPRAYIHVSQVESMGREVGMVPASEVEQLQEAVAEYARKVRDLEAMMQEWTALRKLEAVHD